MMSNFGSGSILRQRRNNNEEAKTLDDDEEPSKKTTTTAVEKTTKKTKTTTTATTTNTNTNPIIPNPPNVIRTTSSSGDSSSWISLYLFNNNNNSKTPDNDGNVKNSESKLRKIMIRVLLSIGMFGIFTGSVYMGHLYMSALVALIELMLFKELVRVRYNAHFDTIKDTIPLFRTTQWCWFAVSIFYTYGDFFFDVLSSNAELHYLLSYIQYLPSVSFLLYSGTFVLTISTLQRDNIKFQMNQLCWTSLVLCLTVGQLKYIFHNIYNGFIWFVLPCCLVFTNDIMAYVSGMTYGRKFIHRPFISLSPNKTWEGFIGGWFFTMITAWYLSRLLAQYTWMTCPVNEFTLTPSSLNCQVHPVFQEAHIDFPSQIFELFPRGIVKMLFPRIVEICVTKPPPDNTDDFFSSFTSKLQQLQPQEQQFVRCVSGEHDTQSHHHFELKLKHNFYPIQLHALWLGLFASLVAPFGGFLASGIKRAYSIKDFDSIIPGHGGVMDRMDCQFLMALCTWVHYNTFVKLATVSVPKLTYLYTLLTDQEKEEFLTTISAAVITTKKGAATNNNKIRFEDYAF